MRALSEAVIFKDKFEILDFNIVDYFGIPKFEGEVVDFFYGLDFGWVHPTAIIETFRYNGCLYITNEIVGKEMDIDDITIRFRDEMPYGHLRNIYADAARPDLIDALANNRLSKYGNELPRMNIEPAKKGAGSVEAGITRLKTHKKIYIHPKCVNTINNFKKYSYKKDKSDIITTAVLKIDDDCIDALRYAYTPLIGEDTTGIVWTDEDIKELNLPL